MKKINKTSLKLLNLVLVIGILSFFIVNVGNNTNWNIKFNSNNTVVSIHPFSASTPNETNIASDVLINGTPTSPGGPYSVYRGIQTVNITYNDMHSAIAYYSPANIIANITFNIGKQINVTMSSFNSTQYSCLFTPGVYTLDW